MRLPGDLSCPEDDCETDAREDSMSESRLPERQCGQAGAMRPQLEIGCLHRQTARTALSKKPGALRNGRDGRDHACAGESDSMVAVTGA